MAGFEGFDAHSWNLFEQFGIHHPLLRINPETIISTWIVLGIILLLAVAIRFLLLRSEIITFIVFKIISYFIDLVVETLGSFTYIHFSFITSLFLYIALCNWISIIPWVEEPTKDLNTTLGLGLISFFYKDIQAIRVNGFLAYAQEFLHPFFLMFPLNVVGHFSKIISMSFRLFGNIFGGAIITQLYTSAIAGSLLLELLGIIFGINFLILFFFIIFEGYIQAFVFTMLSLSYLSIALQHSVPGEYD